MNARASISDMPDHERPLSELYRLAASAWVEADAKARELDELKGPLLDQKKQDLILAAAENQRKLADNAAEREVRASEDWHTYIRAMVDAKTEANRWQVEMKRIDMRMWEINRHDANIRADMRLNGR